MPKLFSKPVSFDRTKPYNQNLADAINAHWKVHVAKPGLFKYMESTLINAVPRIAHESSYKHLDIVWFYRDLNGKWNVRK